MREAPRGTSRFLKLAAGCAVGAAAVIASTAFVLVRQQRHVAQLVHAKADLDWEIFDVEEAMAGESDPRKLAELDERFARLTAAARHATQDLREAGEWEAAGMTAEGDELDRDLRKILARFDAETYAIPPAFKERLQFHIDELRHAPNLKSVYGRKQKYWPMIVKEFGALGLPEEMAYIAWAETQFDPNARSKAGAAGMWQLVPDTARDYSLRVDDEVDERLDPARSTRAAARHLATLLGRFGEESFMLAMASYNRGEAGVRRVLDDVAGLRKERRDFWDLYRLKRLPDETREFVPKVLAALIVSTNARKYGLEPAPAAPPKS